MYAAMAVNTPAPPATPAIHATTCETSALRKEANSQLGLFSADIYPTPKRTRAIEHCGLRTTFVGRG